MAPHSSVVSWRIPWTEEPGGLQPMGSQSWTRLSDLTTARAHCSSFLHVAFSSPFLSPLI